MDLKKLIAKIKKDCKTNGRSYLSREESEFALNHFRYMKAKYDQDLPTYNGRGYKWFEVILENRHGIWYVNFTLNAIRSETFQEYYTARPDQIWK